jgi:O-antigen/teichoic acid export membrane protein
MAVKRLFKNEFVRDFSTLLSGALIASALPLLFSFLISRLYTPAQFGVLGVVTAILSSLTNVAGGRYDLAVMLPEKNEDSTSLVHLGGIISLAVALTVLLVLVVGNSSLLQLLEIQSLGWYALTIPILLWCMAIYKPLNFWMNRNRMYKQNSVAKVTQGMSISLFTLLLGYIQMEQGLVLGYFFGWLVYIIVIVTMIYNMGTFSFKLSFPDIKRVAREYKDFPRFNVVSSFLNDSAGYMAVFIITLLFTVEETGYYNFSRQYLFVPLSLLSVTLSNVYFQRIASKINKRESLKKEFKIVSALLLLVSTLSILVIFFFGEWIFDVVFGGDWSYSGKISAVLIFGFAIKFMVSPFGQLIVALKQLKLALIFPIIYFSLMLSLYFFPKQSFEEFLKDLVLFEVISYLIYLSVAIFCLVGYEKKISASIN